MKVLYAAYKYDPRNPDLGSSLDYECLQAIERAGFETEVVGPVTESLSILERTEYWFWRQYTKITGKKNLKFPLTLTWKSSQLLNRAVKQINPDVVFSVFPPSFVFYQGNVPCVWYFDTTFWGLEQEWPLYGRLPLKIGMWQEDRTLRKVTRAVTMSDWSKSILVEQYQVPAEKVDIVPLFATLPASVVPDHLDVERVKKLELPIKLLLVGRVFERKGIDIAIQVADMLNSQGIPATLTICGLDSIPGNIPDYIQFTGSYKKSDPVQLQKYVDWYQWAHFLIHPARFEAGGTVLSEAAAFATPSITNNTGGLATTVRDGVSGIVLPRGSAADSYVAAIKDLISRPERYYELCRTTKQRYERELNSQVAGAMLADILRKAAAR